MLIRRKDTPSKEQNHGSWDRVHDFFSEYKAERMVHGFGNNVSFRNRAPEVIIREIIASQLPGDLTIGISTCPSKFTKVLQACGLYFKVGEYTAESKLATIFIKFKSPATLQQLNCLFNHINTHLKNEIPAIIMKELQQICKSVTSPHEVSQTHLLPEGKSSWDRTHLPRDETLASIINGAHWAKEDTQAIILKKIKKELRRHAYVNEVNYLGHSLLFTIINSHFYSADLNYRLAIIEVLLGYGANFLQRENGTSFSSPFDNACMRRDTHALKLFQAAATKVKRPIAIETNGVDLYKSCDKNSFVTYLYLKKVRDKETTSTYIFTHLKPLDQLSPTEKHKLFLIFEHYFKHPTNPHMVKKIFEDDFAATSKKWVDIYYNPQGEIIGFSLFEFLKDTCDPTRYSLADILLEKDTLSRLTVHTIYSAIVPEYREYGIVKPLMFRLAFSLQKILPHCEVGVFYCSIHANSFRLAANLHAFPQYNSSDSDEIPQHILNVMQQVYGKDVQYHYDGTQHCYVKENDALFVEDDAGESIAARLYQNHIVGVSEEIRGAPVYFAADKENEAAFLKGSVLTREHLENLARYIDRTVAGNNNDLGQVVNFPGLTSRI